MLATASCPSNSSPFRSVLSVLSPLRSPSSSLRSPRLALARDCTSRSFCARPVSAEVAPASCAPSLRPSSTHERGCSAHTALLQQQAAAPRQDMEIDTDARAVLWLESGRVWRSC